MPSYFEYVGNLHMHTPYSDGEGSYEKIAQAALAARLDFVAVTNHNILVQGVEGYHGDEESGYVLLVTGEEIHDRVRQPQCNHLLVYGAEAELASRADDPQALLNATSQAGGMAFWAHPTDRALEQFGEPAIPWVDRHVDGFTGLEIWNYMSGFKPLLAQGLPRALRAVFLPEQFVTAPDPDTLALWDELLGQGRRVVGIGGADAHGTVFRFGPLRHTVFPYDFLFSCVNTHVLTLQPLSGDWREDRNLIYRGIRQGNAFVAYDLIGSGRGFRFSGHGQAGHVLMGGSIRLGAGVTLQALTHERCHFKLIRHGEVVAEEQGRENLTYTARQGGAYRVEVWKTYRGEERTWILSNPIYVEDSNYTLR